MLALVGRGAGVRALYEAFYRQLVETAPLAESELTELAKRRGEATVRALSEGGSVAAGASRLARPKPRAAPGARAFRRGWSSAPSAPEPRARVADSHSGVLAGLPFTTPLRDGRWMSP
jgi:hypothetical protein